MGAVCGAYMLSSSVMWFCVWVESQTLHRMLRIC